MPVWNDKMKGNQPASGHVSVNSAFTWSLLLCNGYQSCSLNMWVLQHHCACLWYKHHYIFLCIGGGSSNEISLAQITLTIPVVYTGGCMLLGSDLTQWPPKEILSAHWDTTGQTTLEDHWSHKCTGMPLQPHRLMRGPSGVPVATQC